MFPTALSTSSCIFCHTGGRILKEDGTQSNRVLCTSRQLSEHQIPKQNVEGDERVVYFAFLA